MAGYFTAAIRLNNRRCVVVGGGAVAFRRICSLLEGGADIVVVAPNMCEPVRELAKSGSITLIEHAYERGDIAQAFLVVAATNSSDVNRIVTEDACALGILCNDTEDAERGDLIVPGAVRRGDLLMAVTTCGSSPPLTADICRELDARFGPEYADFVAILSELRSFAKQRISNPKRRRAVLTEAARNTALLDLIREGRTKDARTEAFSCISLLQD